MTTGILAFARARDRAGGTGTLLYESGAFHVDVDAWWAPEARRATGAACPVSGTSLPLH